jgi:hypothetical protein
MRRDFTQIVSIIETHAFMHQLTRERDERGRILADERDYRAAYRLLAQVLSNTLDAVSEETRETVAAVEELSAEQEYPRGVSCSELGVYLEMSRSGASRRAKSALRNGYLANNEERKGHPARLVVADALPARRSVLPAPEDLFAETTPAK